MPVDANAPIEVTGFSWVPPFARGHVRDIRVRWALEEAGKSYRTRLFHAMKPRPELYFEEQPFGQVPAYGDGTVQLFESGAIALHIAQDCETLLPADPAGRARATTWVIAALNSVEPMISELNTIDVFSAGEEWARLRRPGAEDQIRGRLAKLGDWLGDKTYLEDDFTVGDLMMASVLRGLDGNPLMDEQPRVARYYAHCIGRPAFQAALAAQMADFTEEAKEGELA
ncbi:MAG: glutathione S-transferase family protein [Sphingobium sp.]|uniref:glutathione S-transferase family protein n=1 Tax=Sphingobium sp. TaxID=1912891 RepID=UPI0029BABDB7|nr:glutathione S-transferase family protein [Sphingobium sp.]MDX3911660.1 glutathione S-transferase family protein [Sphingobium sp.]